jgi:starvation-inducible outer membrane lipoprotein
MTQRFALRTVLFFVIALLLSACATSEDTLTGESVSQSGTPVPGEKMSDDQKFAPSGPAGGSVRW